MQTQGREKNEDRPYHSVWTSLFLATGLLASTVPSIGALAPLSLVKDAVRPMPTLTTLETQEPLLSPMDTELL